MTARDDNGALARVEGADGNKVVQLSKREQNKRENRAAILRAAQEVFAELGYGETTIRDIIRRAGLGSGTFYNYFESKEQVFEALADDSALQIRPLLRQVRLEASSFDEFVEKTFLTLFQHMLNDRAYFDVMRRNSGAIRVRMDTPEIIAGLNEFQEDLEDAMDQGLCPRVDPEYLATAMAGVAFDLSDRALERDPPDVEGAARFAASLILSGINGFRQDNQSNDKD